MTQHTCSVTHRIACLNGGKGDDLGDMIAAVFLGGVTNHLVAIARVKVHVDIRHADTRGVQESFEQQVVLEWVEIGNAQAIRHCTPCRRSTTRSYANACLARITNEIPHNEEVRVETHIPDDFEFVGKSFNSLRRKVVAPALLGSFPCEMR
ncbi:unannotated protein [freshwater metagenome]|uniref:Unannotated protein n=1 Tax=freshwater metagenome TaxID=449393 RepID=A0A6J6E420_9ZZZZ